MKTDMNKLRFALLHKTFRLLNLKQDRKKGDLLKMNGTQSHSQHISAGLSHQLLANIFSPNLGKSLHTRYHWCPRLAVSVFRDRRGVKSAADVIVSQWPVRSDPSVMWPV